MHLINHGYFDYGKDPNIPNAWIKITQVLGYLVYICGCSGLTLKQLKTLFSLVYLNA